MKTKLLAIALFTLTLGVIVYYPQLQAKSIDVKPVVNHITTQNKPRIDVVFVLDTTGSMGGLIQTAKDKIWSIASTMASAQPTPEIRIGLVAYRDRGDEYVTKLIDLSADLDSVYAALMDFQADGGGDTPESVNKALYDAVHGMSWSQQEQTYQTIFLIGDAPPQMNYDEVQYPEIVAEALKKGIVINTIQCGEMSSTIAPWTQIASLAHGNFFKVNQAGGTMAYLTPYDDKIAQLSAELDDTRLYFGSKEEKAKMQNKIEATDKMHAEASITARARRAVFNASVAGKSNLLGENELVDAISSGDIELDEISQEALPAALKPMARAEQKEYVATLSVKRDKLQRQIRELSEDRDGYLAKKVEAEGGRKDSLDSKIYEAVKQQAGKAGLEYTDSSSH